MNIKRAVKNNNFFLYLYDRLKELYFKRFSDEGLIRKRFKKKVGRGVNLENPKEFNDKLQWLKLYWYDPIATQSADKYEVRKIVENRIGDEYLNELIDVYESVDEINVDELPESFVLKGTHASGYNIICKDKNKMNWKLEFNKMKRWLHNNYYWRTREWVYKDIKPRIICERLLIGNDNNLSLTDYKIYCFNGQPTYCQVIRDRDSSGTIDFFDTEWNHMNFTGLQNMPNSTEKIMKPDRYSEMLNLANKLSRGFPFVRVDFYYVQGDIFFGELTFFPAGGFGTFNPPVWNGKIGELLDLPQKY